MKIQSTSGGASLAARVLGACSRATGFARTHSVLSKSALALCWILGIVGCAASFSLEAEAELVGQSGRVKLGYDGRDVIVERIPGNDRADVKFYDAQGVEIPNSGATGVGQGDTVPVPPGATHCTVSGASTATSCTGCTPPGASGGGDGGGGMFGATDDSVGSADTGAPASQQQAAPDHLLVRAPHAVPSKWVHVFTLAGDFDGTTAWSNVSASFVVQGTLGASQLGARISGILSGGPGTQVPPGVTIDTFVRMTPEVLGARLVVGDATLAITQAQMDWNGSAYASLTSNANVYAAPNGWKVLEVFLPLTDLNIAIPGSAAWNQLDLIWTTYEDAMPNEIHQSRYYDVP